MFADENDAVRPIRALLRGLETLQTLNRQDGLTVSEVASRTGLPRTTAYRILETLCAGGYVVRDDADDRYRPTLQVQGLADGYADDRWIAQSARREVEELCRAILWPLMLWTFAGGMLRLRITTDRMSPLALERYAPGAAQPLVGTSAGTIWLASMPAPRAAAVLEAACGGDVAAEALIEARGAVDEARERGYALDLRPVRGEADVAVPVRCVNGEPCAVLSMRFIRSALTHERIAEEYVPQLHAAAARVGAQVASETARALAMAS